MKMARLTGCRLPALYPAGPLLWDNQAMKKRERGRMLPLLALLLAGLLPAGSAAGQDLPRGTPIDSVACAGDAGQSYALYLPAQYSCDRRWPIIYCFEPGARGPIPIRLFQAAAERYGYILACSNNSRNGPWGPIGQALRAVWKDTHERFCIDDARVYSAGHSGGAQVALTFGLFLGRPWAGAIACCGGLPERMATDALPRDLAVFVTTGLYDFNYWPSRNILAAMKALGLANRLEIFPDGHTWMPGDVAMDAVSWLELQAMKRGRQKKDEAWIAAQFAARLQQARELEEAGKAVEAYEAYRDLAGDFRGLMDAAPAEKAAARLDRPAETEKYAEALKAAEKEETRRYARADGAMRALVNAASARERRDCLKALGIPALLREKGDGSAAGLAANRLLRFIFMEAAENANQAYGRGEMKKAAMLYELTVLIDPGRGGAWYNLACVYSRLGEKKDALRALEAAVRNGVRDSGVIGSDPDLEAIRREPAYIRLLEGMKKDPPAGKP